MTSDFDHTELPLYFICSFGIVSNVLLLIAFVKDPLKCFRNSATYLVANLACSDLITCFCGLLKHAVHRIFFVIWLSIMPVSILTIFAIALDRYLMVAFPFKHKFFTNGKKIGLWIILCWVIPLSSKINDFLSQPIVSFKESSSDLFVGLTLTFLAGFLYVMTTRSLRIQARNLESYNPEDMSNRTQAVRASRERRFMNTIALVACITVIGVAPFLIVHSVLTKGNYRTGSELIIEILHHFSHALFFGTFAVNPMIYFLRLINYRKTFLALYWRC